MEELKGIFDALFESCPDIKVKYDEDVKWREERQSVYVEEGYSEDNSKKLAWSDYWEMVKIRDGVNFGFNKLN